MSSLIYKAESGLGGPQARARSLLLRLLNRGKEPASLDDLFVIVGKIPSHNHGGLAATDHSSGVKL